MKDAKLTIVRLSKADVIATSGPKLHTLSDVHNGVDYDRTLIGSDYSRSCYDFWYAGFSFKKSGFSDITSAYLCDQDYYDYAGSYYPPTVSSQWNGYYTRNNNIFTWHSSSKLLRLCRKILSPYRQFSMEWPLHKKQQYFYLT